MNLEKRFIAISNFIKEHEILHSNEPLALYPFKNLSYLDWTKDLETLKPSELISLENIHDSTRITNNSYRDFLESICSLTILPQIELETEDIAKNLLRKISLKKQHEIKIVKAQTEKLKSQNFIDVGSGAGHLSSILLANNSKESICIDMSCDYQDIGKKKLLREAPEILTRLKYKTQLIESNTKLPEIKDATLIGLHACGDLSSVLVQNFPNSKLRSFLNYGCCYHKLSPENLNISQLAKSHGPKSLNKYSLTLAAKSFKQLSELEFNKRLKVKNYRYALHFLMNEKLKLEFRSIGNTQASDYESDFASYAKKYLPETKDNTNKDLNDFYRSKSKDLKSVLRIDLIRSHLSRLIEIYIILDRAIFLKEQGYEVEIGESFDQKISPRNISLISRK